MTFVQRRSPLRKAGFVPPGSFSASREQERDPRFLGDWIADEWSKPSSERVQKCTSMCGTARGDASQHRGVLRQLLPLPSTESSEGSGFLSRRKGGFSIGMKSVEDSRHSVTPWNTRSGIVQEVPSSTSRLAGTLIAPVSWRRWFTVQQLSSSSAEDRRYRP